MPHTKTFWHLRYWSWCHPERYIPIWTLRFLENSHESATN
jgi:hypothetical protein